MSIKEISFTEAMGTSKTNPNCNFHKGEPEKISSVENLASNRLRKEELSLHISPAFKISKQNTIFTIGSCFARRIELAMFRQGMNVPAFKSAKENKEIFDTFRYLNKYNSYSMLYEIKWALGLEEMIPEKHLYRETEDSWFDPQSVAVKITSFEEVLNRRKELLRLTRYIIDSDVVTVTLGLIEAWYDKELGIYLNSMPPVKMIMKNKDRFCLRLIDYNENLQNLEEIYQILCTHGKKDFNMLVTVSPVPLLRTFTNNDIITANLLSKSVLLTAAHTFVEKYDNVSYFPSYELATMSSRELIWENDLRHVSEKGANFIVGTFLENYLEQK
ncbi:MAG: hypothetical protein C0602_03925 [Denitrovibrio sp.]|nr:MAG: hypothetical protein C0602_03925 [Denitrovibrio sp.]